MYFKWKPPWKSAFAEGLPSLKMWNQSNQKPICKGKNIGTGNGEKSSLHALF